MTFDKDFPSLKNKIRTPVINNGCECCGPEIMHEIDTQGVWIHIDDVENNCQDNIKVKAAIDKFYYSFNRTNTTFENNITKLIKELNL